MKVNFTDNDYEENIGDLSVVDDLYNGSSTIKSKGAAYLMPFVDEDQVTFDRRLKLATFYNFFSKSVDGLSSSLLRKQPQIDYKVKDETFLSNVDGKGSSIQSFINDLSTKAIIDGMDYIWVDSQRIDGTLSLDMALDVKPYFKILRRSDVINKSLSFESGSAVLKQIVIRQTISVQKNEFESQDKDVYVVLREHEGLVYEEVNGKFKLIDEWVNDLGYIPVIPVYAAKTGYLTAKIPMYDLAEMNLDHYNAYSEYRSNLRLSAVPVAQIYAEQNPDNKTSKQDNVSIGLSKVLLFDDKSKEGFEWASTDSNAPKNLLASVEGIEKRLNSEAVSILNGDTFNTATEAKIADKNGNKFLLELAYSLEDALNAAFRVVSDYIGRDLSITVETSKDFDSLALDPQVVDRYLAMHRDGIISKDTLWDILTKGDVVEIPDYDIEKQKITDEIGQI